LYWFDFLLGAELYGKSTPNLKHAVIDKEAVYYCPQNKELDPTPGWYGAAIHYEANSGMFQQQWGSDPFQKSVLPYIKLSRVRRASEFPLLADFAMAISKFPGRGARFWLPSAFAVSANASSRGMIWLPHSNRANVLFADGHAESCDTGQLMNTLIVNKVSGGVTKYDITHWATEKFVLESR
jgi:prepilin-type processing-associated H-X9-DG protein